MEHPEAKGVMESYVVTHILPDFGSEHAYLRAVVSRHFVFCQSEALYSRH